MCSCIVPFILLFGLVLDPWVNLNIVHWNKCKCGSYNALFWTYPWRKGDKRGMSVLTFEPFVSWMLYHFIFLLTTMLLTGSIKHCSLIPWNLFPRYLGPRFKVRKLLSRLIYSLMNLWTIYGLCISVPQLRWAFPPTPPFPQYLYFFFTCAQTAFSSLAYWHAFHIFITTASHPVSPIKSNMTWMALLTHYYSYCLQINVSTWLCKNRAVTWPIGGNTCSDTSARKKPSSSTDPDEIQRQL